MESYDLVVIGSGPAGYVAGIRASQLGAKVCVVEKEELGGVCLNRGCIPTKSLIKSAELLRQIRSAPEFGVKIPEGIELNLEQAIQRKDQVVKTLARGIDALFKSWGITLKKGTAQFQSRTELLIKSEHREEKIVAGSSLIATGSSPARLPIFPVDGIRILDSDHLLKMSQVPKSIIIIGAGAIGLEWAFILKEFGAEVTIVEMLAQVAPSEEEMIGALLLRELKKRKIRALVGEKIIKVQTNGEGLLAYTESGEELRAEKMLVSIGRTPNSQGLGLEKVGVETDQRGFIKVNSRLETSVPGIYSAGDVVGGMLLAHKASAEAKVAVANALGKKEEMDYQIVPMVMFTSPQVASVGLKERDAKEKGINYSTASFPFRGLGKAHANGEIAGEVKLVFEKESLRLLGCHIIGPEASSLIHEAVMALKMKASVKELAETIHAHPTLSEALMEAGEAGLGLSIHLPKSKS